MKEKNLTQEESLAIITEMIGKAKTTFNESGASAILWGAVVAICGLVTFAEAHWDFSIGFDIWLLIFAAIIPQVWFIIRESRRQVVKTHAQAATDVVWLVYGISIACIVSYALIAPGVSAGFLQDDGMEMMYRVTATGELRHARTWIPSLTSVYLIIYAFPTMATGLICRFGPMIYGALLCYVFFFVSLYVPFKYDMLLAAGAGIFNWLIPGIILQKKFRKEGAADV